jgi:hypothetical protein
MRLIWRRLRIVNHHAFYSRSYPLLDEEEMRMTVNQDNSNNADCSYRLFGAEGAPRNDMRVMGADLYCAYGFVGMAARVRAC